METSARGTPQGLLRRLSPDHLGLVGQTSTSWGVGGGLIATLVVCGHVLAGSVSSSLAFFTATLFFIAGSAAAFLHGGLLAYLGRPEGVSRSQAVSRIVLGAGYAIPALALGWFVAMILVLSALAFRSGNYLAFAAALLGWLAAGAFLTWAAVETSRTLSHLLRRWPDARAVLTTLALAFLALVPIFIVTQPEIWIIGVRPTATTATAMALVATIWIAGPLVTCAFLAVRAWRRSHPEGATPPSAVPDR